ncbi:MAG: hypothetical protein O9284_04695 [Steroidobacteraceae bacterium]|jgi:hypothetical protein|nr:hypothetical protein [Steroidobacteraceae bacterium]
MTMLTAVLLLAIGWLGQRWLGARSEIALLRSEVAVLRRRLARRDDR